MITHLPIILLGTVVVALCIAYLIWRVHYQRRYISITDHLSDLLLRNVDAYVLYIDHNFDVIRTNYYALTGTAERERPKVGNLLRCRNGEDAGECGTHDLCSQCPVRHAIAEAFRTKQNFSKLEASMILYTSAEHTNTVECEVSITGSYLTIGGEERMLLTVHDITDQKRIRRELEEARIRAEESDRMKTQFLANTSHELRTPLNAILGFAELLIAEPSQETRQEYARIIRTNNEVLLQLVNDILDLSKIEAGTLEYIYTDEELNSIMKELEDAMRMKMPEESAVNLVFRHTCECCIIRTDRRRLMQVMSNFLTNAIKFTTQGEIVFGFKEQPDSVEFYVSDTGKGIPESQHALVFHRFVKINSHKQGVGIGLAICKSIVESMGGSIGFKSEVGKGSVFHFTLPRAPKEKE